MRRLTSSDLIDVLADLFLTHGTPAPETTPMASPQMRSGAGAAE
ncbi:hypothetical protein [Neoroseomonas rubea]|nr:hypothetical protein [Roseomonas rubea]